jgi:hypothetical protein
MTISQTRRWVVRFAVALILGMGVASGSQLTPIVSAQPPTRCADVDARLAQAEVELRTLQRTLNHLLEGGVTQDEVVFVSEYMNAISGALDEVSYLKSLMYQCLKDGYRNPWVQRSRLTKLTRLQTKLATLQATAASLREAVTAQHR